MRINKKATFRRQNKYCLLRVSRSGWRRPKGNQSKQRRKFLNRGAMPNPGYGTPKSLRGLHPCGKLETVITNENELKNFDPKIYCVKISSKVGSRKRIGLQKNIESAGFKLLNPKVIEIKKKEEVKK